MDTQLHLPQMPNHNTTLISLSPSPPLLQTEDTGGCVAFLIHESIQLEQLPTIQDPYIENITIKVEDIKIINLYIPPACSCAPGYKPNINPFLLDRDAIVIRDLNSHDALWHSSIQDARGAEIAETIGSSNYGILNNDSTTHLPHSDIPQPSCPDLSLASMALLPYSSLETITALGSD